MLEEQARGQIDLFFSILRIKEEAVSVGVEDEVSFRHSKEVGMKASTRGGTVGVSRLVKSAVNSKLAHHHVCARRP